MLDKAKRFLKSIQLKNKQKNIEKRIAKEGLTDELLEAQVKLNQERNKHDIPDESEFVYGEFVQ